MNIQTRSICSIHAMDKRIPVISMEPAYAGGFLLLPEFDMIPVVIDLATLSMKEANVPILWMHDPQLVLGHTTSLHNNGRKITATGLLTATTGDAGKKVAEIVAASRLGHRWEASVGSGTLVTQNLVWIPPRETVQANSQTFTGPLYLTRDIRLCEISIVPVGADRSTHLTITASGLAKGQKMTFADWLTSKSVDKATLTPALADELKAQYLAENPGADMAALDGEIAALLQTLLPPSPPAAPPVQATDTPPSEPPKVQANNTPPPEPPKVQASGAAQAASQAYFNSFPAPPQAATSRGTRTSGFPSLQKTLTAAMLMNNGWDAKRIEATGIPSVAIDAATGLEYRHCGFHNLFRKVIQASGYRYGSDLNSTELVQEGLGIIAHNSRKLPSLLAAGLSTDVTSFVMKDTIDKEVMLRYEEMVRPLLDIAKKRPTKSFREVTDFRFGMEGVYQVVPPGGDAPSSKLKDEGVSMKIQKFMKSAKITFEQMVNDDLNVLGDIGEMLATDASDAQEELLAKALLSGKGQFAQCDSASLGIAGLGKAVKAFRSIKNMEGKTMNRNASALLVPSALEALAQQLYVSTTLNETTTVGTPSPDANIYQSKYTPIVCPLMDTDSGLKGASDSDWFLLADQKRSPILAAAHLEGYLSPQVKESEITNTYDIQFTSMFTFAAAIYYHRGAVRCKSGS